MIAVGWSSLADTIGRDRLRPCPPERACPTHAGMDVLPHLLHSRRVGAWSMSGHGQEPVPTGLSLTEPYWAEAGCYQIAPPNRAAELRYRIAPPAGGGYRYYSPRDRLLVPCR